MTRSLFLALALALTSCAMPPLSADAVAAQSIGVPRPVGIITTGSGTTQNNHGTAVPFLNTGDAMTGRTFLVQPDVAVYCNFAGTDNTVAATAATVATMGAKLAADEKVTVHMGGYGWMACLPVAAVVATIRVWEMQ